MNMHMLSRLNRFTGKTDNLVIATYRFTGLQIPYCDLVSSRYEAAHRNVFDRCASHQLLAGDQHVITCVQSNESTLLGHGFSIYRIVYF